MNHLSVTVLLSVSQREIRSKLEARLGHERFNDFLFSTINYCIFILLTIQDGNFLPDNNSERRSPCEPISLQIQYSNYHPTTTSLPYIGQANAYPHLKSGSITISRINASILQAGMCTGI